MSGNIAYEWKGNLYLNLTNRCSLACCFCAKWPDFFLGDIDLRLDDEPTIEEVMEAVGDPRDYPQIVFCGFGEPTYRLYDLLEITKRLKEQGAHFVRLNTNGTSDLIHKIPTAKHLAGVVDSVSVSLNAQDEATYNQLCKPEFGQGTWAAVKTFILDAKKYVHEVTASVVRLPQVDVDACRKIAEEELGVKFRLRG